MRACTAGNPISSFFFFYFFFFFKVFKFLIQLSLSLYRYSRYFIIKQRWCHVFLKEAIHWVRVATFVCVELMLVTFWCVLTPRCHFYSWHTDNLLPLLSALWILFVCYFQNSKEFLLRFFSDAILLGILLIDGSALKYNSSLLCLFYFSRFLIWEELKVFLFSHIVHPDCSFPPPPVSLPISPLPQFHAPYVSTQKRAGFPGSSTKHSVVCYNNTRHIPLHKAWMRHPSKKKRSHKQAKESLMHRSHC